MSSFTRPPVYESIPGKRIKRIVRPFRYYPIEKHVGPYVLVPQGFLTDGASIPRWIQPLIGSGPFDGAYDAAAIVHDRLYQSLGRFWADVDQANLYLSYDPSAKIIAHRGTSCVLELNRRACDKILLEGCRILGGDTLSNTLRYNVMYAGVRVGGWIPWRKYAKIHKKQNVPLGSIPNLGQV